MKVLAIIGIMLSGCGLYMKENQTKQQKIYQSQINGYLDSCRMYNSKKKYYLQKADSVAELYYKEGRK